MNPRVSRVERAREQGDRVPDRQDRGAARGRLPARRDHERHHRRDAGVVRADDRLRRHEGAALGVREAARRVAGARHDDAVGRRGDGDRAHVPRVAAEGAALARDRPRSGSTATRPSASYDAHRRRRARARWSATPTPERLVPASKRRCARGVPVERLPRGHRDRPVVPRPASLADRRGRARGSQATRPRRRSTRRDWRRAKRLGFADAQLALPVGRSPRRRCRDARLAAGVRRHLQDRRHVRGRVRGAHAVPLRHLRGRGRGRAARPARRS